MLPGTSCAERYAGDPTVVQAVCVGGVVEPPTLTLADTDGITYSVESG